MPLEVKALTLLEFNMILEGYLSREEEQWDRTRNMMSFIATFSGMGSKKAIQPQEIMKLHKDNLERTKPIRSYKEAIELLKSFR